MRAAADAADEPSEEQSEQLERLQAESPHAERRHERMERRHEHAERWFKEARTARLAAEEVLRTANEVLVAKLSEAAAGAAGCRMSVVDCGIPGSASLPVTWKLSRKLSHSTKGKTCGLKCPKRRPEKFESPHRSRRRFHRDEGPRRRLLSRSLARSSHICSLSPRSLPRRYDLRPVRSTSHDALRLRWPGSAPCCCHLKVRARSRRPCACRGSTAPARARPSSPISS